MSIKYSIKIYSDGSEKAQRKIINLKLENAIRMQRTQLIK